MNRYDHIIWDWNGTILNDAWLCVEVMNEVLKIRRLPLINIDSYRKHFCFPVKEYYKILGFNFNKEKFEISGLEFIDKYLDRRYDAQLYANIREVIKTLSEHGVTHSILSAQHENMLNDVASYYDMNKYFIHLVGLKDQYAHGKLDAGKSLLKRLDYKKNKIILIGDTVHDSDVASSLNIDCILLSCGHNDKSQLELEPSRATIIDSHDKIISLIVH